MRYQWKHTCPTQAALHKRHMVSYSVFRLDRAPALKPFKQNVKGMTFNLSSFLNGNEFYSVRLSHSREKATFGARFPFL